MHLKKTLFNSLKFIFLVFILDLIIGFSLEKLYYSQTSGEFNRLNYSLYKTKEDFLVFGSSRANHHYNPKIISDSLKLSYYNVGQDGQSIFYHYAILKSTLKRHKPKIIILDINFNEFRKTSKAYERLASLLPHYGRNKELTEVILLRNSFEKVKLFSKIYPYNSLVITLLANKINSNTKEVQNDRGFIPLPKGDIIKLNKSLKNIEKIIATKYEIDTLKIIYFKKFIDTVKENNIEFFIFTSPYLSYTKLNDRSVEIVDSICKKSKVKYFDFSYFKNISSSPELFMDYGHLNFEGADLYSEQIIKILSN